MFFQFFWAESRTLVVSILLDELRRLDLRKTLNNSNLISQNAYSDVNRVNSKSPKSNVFVWVLSDFSLGKRWKNVGSTFDFLGYKGKNLYTNPQQNLRDFLLRICSIFHYFSNSSSFAAVGGTFFSTILPFLSISSVKGMALNWNLLVRRFHSSEEIKMCSPWMLLSVRNFSLGSRGESFSLQI